MYQFFNENEFKCSHCGKLPKDYGLADCQQNLEFTIKALDYVRIKLGKPIIVTSGWRCKDHPVEAKKEKPGQHYFGRAVDISTSDYNSVDKQKLLFVAATQRFKGLGVAKSFIHLDRRKNYGYWTYD